MSVASDKMAKQPAKKPALVLLPITAAGLVLFFILGPWMRRIDLLDPLLLVELRQWDHKLSYLRKSEGLPRSPILNDVNLGLKGGRSYTVSKIAGIEHLWLWANDADMLIHVATLAAGGENRATPQRGSRDVQQDVLRLYTSRRHLCVRVLVDEHHVVQVQPVEVNILAAEQHHTSPYVSL